MSNVTVIIPFHNAGGYIIDSIDSIRSQEYPFKEICLYLIDAGSTDWSRHLAVEYSTRYTNIYYYRLEKFNISAAKNKGIELSVMEGSTYTFFLNAADKYKKNHIKKCIELLDNYPDIYFVLGVLRYFEAKSGLYRLYNLQQYKSTREMDLLENADEPFYIGNVSQGGWITEFLESHQFNENIKYAEDTEFFCRILAENKFIFTNDIEYMHRIVNTDEQIPNNQNNFIELYDIICNVFTHIYTNMIELHNNVPYFIQTIIIENICELFTNAVDSDYKTEIDYENIDNALRFIFKNTVDIIIESKQLDYWNTMHLFTYKYGKPCLTKSTPLPAFILCENEEYEIGRHVSYLGSDPLYLFIVNEKESILTIRAAMRCLTYNHFNLDITSDFESITNTVTDPIKRDIAYFCNMEVFPWNYYEITIYLNKLTKKSSVAKDGLIRFILTTDYGYSVNVRYDALPLSGIGFNAPFTLGDEYIIKRTKHDNVLMASPFTEYEFLDNCSDIKPFAGIGIPEKESVVKFNTIKNNIVNNFRALSNQRIWLFMDRNNETDNNAEALFRYCVNKDDGIKKYYVIPAECNMEKFVDLPYIVFGSLEFQLFCCFAEKFISSFLYDEGLTFRFGVEKKDKALYEDIRNFKKLARSFFRGDIIHIQHGVIMQDISFYLNKFYENTRLIFNISQKEFNYVKNDLSHAIDSNVLRLTGLPKLDYLEKIKNKITSKIILFAPSFDRNLIKKGKYNPAYKYSDHFKYINGILNSSDLLNMLESNEYTLYFKPHVMLIQQFLDFNIDPRIKVVFDDIERYEMYAMSDLMITDYSGIAFDFAYLKKPVVYAHFAKAKFDETYYSYINDGFGEVCNDMNALIKTITEYINNECKMSELYIKRVDGFFSYQDDNNCERIYQEILKIPDTRKNIF